MSPVSAPPLGGPEPLIDVHAHFHHAGGPRADWAAVNDARFRAVYDDETYGSWFDFTGPNITGQEDWLPVADQAARKIVAVELDVKTEGAGGWNVYVRFIGLG